MSDGRVGQTVRVIVTVFVRRLKEGASFEQFIAEWRADVGFGVPTRVFNAQSLADPRDIISIGFVDVTQAQLAELAHEAQPTEAVRHGRIDTVIESTTLKAQYELLSEHDFTSEPTEVPLDSPLSLLAALTD